MAQTRRPVTRGGLGALATALVLLAGGCGDGDTSAAVNRPASSPSASSPSAASPSGSASPGSPAPVEVEGDYSRYVAIGDSYTAAPLSGENDNAGAGDGCGRSDSNYPALVAEELGDVTLADVSCSGADTTSLIGAQRTPTGVVPPQFEAVTPDTDLITVNIGGNDFGIFSRLIQTCTSLREEDPTGSPCRDAMTADGSDLLLEDVEKLGPRLESVVAGLQDRAPEARILVVGYPDTVPDEGRCDDLPLADGDYAYANEINQALADTQRQAAERAGVTYVDTYAASQGHDICADEPWVNGPVTSARTALAYHPLQVEQDAVARLVLAEL